MPNASLLQHSFLGGEWSKFYQGRYDRPDYRTALNVCLNYIPIEAGTLVRRPGFGWAGWTRGGNLGRTIKYDFQQTTPYVMEFTDAHLRFWQGYNLVTTNDSVGVSSISTANPAVAALASAVTWSTGDEGFFSALGSGTPLLQNRRFTLTKVDTTHFSLADSITGAAIDGSTLSVSGLNAAATINRVLDLVTPYDSGIWSAMRSVQTEQTSFLLHNNVQPNQVIVNSNPAGQAFATFSLAPSFFLDGPYFDPIPGSTVVAGAVSGITTLTAGFQAWSATQAYTKGAFVTSAGVGYQSLLDANVNNTPVSSPTFWKPVSLGAAINNGRGFVESDIGRLVRLFSEPALWSAATTYGIGNLVSYNPSNLPGAQTYWASLTTSNINHVPGTDTVNWTLVSIGGTTGTAIATSAGPLVTTSPVLWTWGKITALSATGVISGATGTNIGNMTGHGGLAAAFDGVTNKTHTTCAANIGLDGYVGKNYTGSPQSISQAVVYPASAVGFADLSDGGPLLISTPVRIRLFAKASAPANSTDGTLLADTGTITNVPGVPVTLFSNDTVSTWNFVWIDVRAFNGGHFIEDVLVAQATFYTNAAAPGVSVNVEILGPPLIYSGVVIQTWRLGLYSNTTGWPTCGTYSDGRLWLAGSVPNRIDASVANGINGIGNGNPIGSVNFSPTDQFGNVLASSGISYTFNAPDANSIFWMIPDLQGIIAGTKAGEWLITAPTAGGISPLNIAARRVTVIGAANIEPRRTEHTTIFVQKFGRKIMEYFADIFSGKFTAPHITEKSKHLTIAGVDEIAYQQELAPIVWARVKGILVGWTYKRDTLMTSQGPTFAAAHRHSLGSGRVIESLTVGPSVGGNLDALTVVTNDPTTNIRFVEILTDILDEGSALASASYLDAAITPTSTTAAAAVPGIPLGGLILNGLWPLNGKTVTAWLGGLDCGDYVVTNGSITVGFGDGIPNGQGAFPAAPNRNDQGLFTQAFVSSGIDANGVTMFTGTMPMRVGFTYTSQGQIVRPNAPAESGARNGPAFGKMRRVHQYAAQLEGTNAISFGTDFVDSIMPSLFRQLNGADITIDTQFNGVFWNAIQDQYSRDGGMLSWQVTRPYIANVVAVGEYLETQDT